MKVRAAVWEEHKAICAIAKLSPYSKGFQEVRFVKEYYEKGWMLVAEKRGVLVGFICVRHLIRKPYTSVYYMGVTLQREGVGTALIRAAQKASPHKEIKLISEKENAAGLSFYEALGFKVEGSGANKQGEPFWRLSLES